VTGGAIYSDHFYPEGRGSVCRNTLVTIYRVTRCHIPEQCCLDTGCNNLNNRFHCWNGMKNYTRCIPFSGLITIVVLWFCLNVTGIMKRPSIATLLFWHFYVICVMETWARQQLVEQCFVKISLYLGLQQQGNTFLYIAS